MLDTSILLVEDNRDCEALAVRALRRAGFTAIAVARDGAEALEVLLGEPGVERTQEPVTEVVLLDMRLPKLDGLDVLKKLREDERTRTLKVIALSASEDPEEMRGCRELGVMGVLPKPLDVEMLKSLLQPSPRKNLRVAVLHAPAHAA